MEKFFNCEESPEIWCTLANKWPILPTCMAHGTHSSHQNATKHTICDSTCMQPWVAPRGQQGHVQISNGYL